MYAFKKDQTLYVNDAEFKVVRTTAEKTSLECIATGELTTESTFNLLNDYVAGKLKTADQKRFEAQVVVKPTTSALERVTGLGNAARAESRRRLDYLTRLEASDAFRRGRQQVKMEILAISIHRGEARPPGVSTVYRWLGRFRSARRDVHALICGFDRQGGKGVARLEPDVEAAIDESIEEKFLSVKAGSAEDVHDAALLKIQRLNTQRVESEWLKLPSLRTVQRRIANLYAFELAVARYGKKEAERRFANHLGARQTSRILELVEIDHTPVDLLVCDHNRVVIGRPTLTAIICRYSRCVLGYHLSLAGHGTSAVFEAIRHALLPKTYLATKYGDLGLEWPCLGWFERIVMDNGTEFHSDAVVDALMTIGIVVEFAASREPNDKPFVERFLRTFNYSFIHRLPGTTLAKIEKRIGFKAEDDAVFTLEELDRIIHVWICSVYHLRPHAGLYGRTPMAVWQESAAQFPPQLKMNQADLDIEFGEVMESALQHYGVDLNTFRYASRRLLTLRRMLPEKAKILVKWPRHDAGYIFVWDAVQHEYFKVPNLDPQFAGLTVEQAQIAKRRLSGDDAHQRTRASAKDLVGQMTQEALQDKKLKGRRKGARFANKTSVDARKEDVVQEFVAQCETLVEGKGVVAREACLDLVNIEVELPISQEV